MFEHQYPLALSSRSYRMSIALVAPLHAPKYQGFGVLEISDEKLQVDWKHSLELMLSRSVSPIRLVSSLSTLKSIPPKSLVVVRVLRSGNDTTRYLVKSGLTSFLC